MESKFILNNFDFIILGVIVIFTLLFIGILSTYTKSKRNINNREIESSISIKKFNEIDSRLVASITIAISEYKKGR